MPVDLSHIKRYELKYKITEAKAAAIKEHIRGICILDKHSDPELGGYIVNNLYFDTPNLQFYYDTKHRKLTRFKPRARYYGNKPTQYIWPEVKYRNCNIIWKKRDRIPLEDWPKLFYPVLSDVRDFDIRDRAASFDDLIRIFNASAVLHVRYFREPFVTELETYGRVTFDRRLTCRKAEGSIDLSFDPAELLYYDDPKTTRHFESPVLLEIKVETFVPRWTIDLIRKFKLVQTGFSKYCYGIDFFKEFTPSIRRSSLFTL